MTSKQINFKFEEGRPDTTLLDRYNIEIPISIEFYNIGVYALVDAICNIAKAKDLSLMLSTTLYHHIF